MSLFAWLAREPAIDDRRWVVVDVEASGLDAARDRLLAIAAIAVRVPEAGAPLVDLGDSFEVVLRQHEATLDKPNILLHGIGIGAQRAGVEPYEALAAFVRWVARSPLVAFHAAFDETMIGRALRAAGRPPLGNPWVDLAQVAEVARPEQRAKSLDEWLGAFGIEVAVRHQAAADTLATTELLLRLWPDIRAQRASSGFKGLQELAAHRRWLRST